ncbi:MAG: S8 family peptidase [Alloprevotella sp.]
MKKITTSLLTLAFALAPLCGVAQNVPSNKLNVSAQMAMRQTVAAQTNSLRSQAVTPATGFVCHVTDAQAVCDAVEAKGGKAMIISDQCVTVHLPANEILDIAGLDCVKKICGPEEMRLFNDVSKVSTGVDKVQAGTELDTPFKGEGVLVGITDIAFQYNHVAFTDADGSSRIVKVWRHNIDGEDPTDNITFEDDEITHSHGTHVAGITSGREVTYSSISGKMNVAGMAPESQLVLATTSSTYDNVLECLVWLKQVAKERNQPMVVNISMGNYIHSANSRSEDFISLESLPEKGVIYCAAMGNENEDDIHVMDTLKNVGDTTYFLMEVSSDYNRIFGACENEDSLQHYKFEVGLINTNTQEFHPFSDEIMDRYSGIVFSTDIDSGSGQQFFGLILVEPSKLYPILGLDSWAGNSVLAVKFTALTPNVVVHGWDEHDKLGTLGSLGVKPDSRFLCCNSAATSNFIGVGSYDNKATYKNMAGSTRTSSAAVPGQLSYFSSQGPLIGGKIDKPTVLAPGLLVCSSVNKRTYDYSSSSTVFAADANARIVKYADAEKGKECFYYGMMSGTSMATPAAAGIIALWLQANPELTPEDVENIIKQTAVHDDLVPGTQGEYQVGIGYGKIDAYAGIKKALQMAEDTGVEQALEADQPVTLQKNADAWRVLFNITVPQAQVSVSTLGGAVVKTVNLGRQTRGSEQTVDLGGLQTGVYVVTISTPQAAISRKFVK